MMTYVAVPYQVYELTKSSWLVGLMSVAQLIPVLIFGLIGGAFADRLDRRKMLLVAEALLLLCALGLAFNTSVAGVFILAALMSAVNAFHRPAMEAMTQKLVEPGDYAAIGA